jgi:hypothetical protein
MATVTLTIPDKTKEELKQFNWVNWSLSVVTVFKMKSIFEKYMKTKKVSDEDWEFCELIDWHPVDELPMKEEHIAELKRALEETPTGKTYNSAEEFFDSLK